MNRATVAAALGMALSMAAGGHATAQVTLRVADSLPATHFFTEQATRFWMDAVAQLAGPEVTFEHFPAGQLGKAGDLFSLTASGVVDIGYVVPSYAAEKLPLTSVAELPGTFETSCRGTMAFWDLARNDGLLATREYGPAGVKVVYAVVMPPYQAFVRGPLATIDDLEGKKLRTSSAGQDAIARRLGAVPVRITAPEVYDALSRGTIDGVIFPASSVLAYDIAGLLDTATSGVNFGSAVLTMMISQDRWNALPAAVQEAMSQAGEATTKRICAYADGALDDDLKKLSAAGIGFADLEEGAAQQLAAEMLGVREEWARTMDGMNVPGTEILKAFEAAIADR